MAGEDWHGRWEQPHDFYGFNKSSTGAAAGEPNVDRGYASRRWSAANMRILMIAQRNG
jgi:hypothetical protein